MLGYLILLFTAVPAIELALLIKVGQHIGVVYTLGIVIVTGIIGAYLAKLQGLFVLRKIQEDINQKFGGQNTYLELSDTSPEFLYWL